MTIFEHNLPTDYNISDTSNMHRYTSNQYNISINGYL